MSQTFTVIFAGAAKATSRALTGALCCGTLYPRSQHPYLVDILERKYGYRPEDGVQIYSGEVSILARRPGSKIYVPKWRNLYVRYLVVDIHSEDKFDVD